MDQRALMHLLKTLSGTRGKSVTDADLAKWLCVGHSTTIQKMRKGERTCRFDQSRWQQAFRSAFDNYHGMDKVYVRSIDTALKDVHSGDQMQIYTTKYQPIFERFLAEVDVSISARDDYVRAIIATAFVAQITASDLLNILKKLSGKSGKDISDDCLSKWFELSSATIQKMRTGSRHCTITQYQFQRAFFTAFENYSNMVITYVDTIDAELKQFLGFDQQEKYKAIYLPLYEKFIQEVGKSKDAHKNYVRSIVGSAYGHEFVNRREKKEKFSWIDDSITCFQREGISYDIIYTDTSCAIICPVDVSPRMNVHISFVKLEADIYCVTTAICQIPRSFETLDLLCRINNAVAHRKQMTLSLDKSNNLIAHCCIRNPRAPGETCLSVLKDARWYLQRVICMFSTDNIA